MCLPIYLGPLISEYEPSFLKWYLPVSTMTKITSPDDGQDSKQPEASNMNYQPGATLTYQQLAVAFLDTTSAHGLPRLRTEFGTVRKATWAVVFVGLTILCCYQGSVLVHKYLQYDVNVAMQIINK